MQEKQFLAKKTWANITATFLRLGVSMRSIIFAVVLVMTAGCGQNQNSNVKTSTNTIPSRNGVDAKTQKGSSADAEVQVLSVDIGDKTTTISLKISNTSLTNKFDYLGWATHRVNEDFAQLKDEHGNNYSLYVTGRESEGATVYPLMATKDILVFQRPVDTAKTLTLYLPGKHVQSTSPIVFTTPTQSFNVPETLTVGEKAEIEKDKKFKEDSLAKQKKAEEDYLNNAKPKFFDGTATAPRTLVAKSNITKQQANLRATKGELERLIKSGDVVVNEMDIPVELVTEIEQIAIIEIGPKKERFFVYRCQLRISR